MAGAALVVAGCSRRADGCARGSRSPRERADDQLDHLEASSPFYRARIQGRRTLTELPFTTKDELRESQRRRPPFGEHLCADPADLVRLHVTSGTTGEPVAIGLTQHDHEANSKVGGEAFAIAGLRPTDTVAHCLNYALYAGGIADHMALEASGATVVPVGVGQSQRLLDLIPRLGITAIFGTLSFPAYLATRAREQGLDPTALGLRHIVTAGEPGAGLGAVRAEIEQAWGVSVTDTFGMSDVWSTMAGECGRGDGLHLTTGDHALLEVVDPETAEPLPLEDGVEGELVWTHLDRRASPLLRYRSSDLATVWTAPCACGRTTPRIRIGGRRDDMLRVQAVNVYPQASASSSTARVTRSSPRATRSSRRCTSTWRGRPTRTGSGPRCAPTSPCTSSRPARSPSPSTRPRRCSARRGATLPDAIRRHREEPH